VDGLTEFLGRDLPLDKLRNFGELDLGNTEGIRSNAETVVAFGTAMTALARGGTATYLASYRTMMANLVDGITSFFNSDLPYDKLMAFGNFILNHDGITRNAESVIAFAGAVKELGSAAGAGSGRRFTAAMADAYSRSLGAPTMWENLEAFGELKLSENIIPNANIIRGFGETVSAFTVGSRRVKNLGETVEHLSRLATVYQRFAQLNTSRMSNSVAAIRDLNNALVFGREQPTPDTAAARPLAATDGAQDRQLQNLLENSSDEGVRMLADALLESNRTTHRLLRELNTSIQNQ
jgi:hypothetical protein